MTIPPTDPRSQRKARRLANRGKGADRLSLLYGIAVVVVAIVFSGFIGRFIQVQRHGEGAEPASYPLPVARGVPEVSLKFDTPPKLLARSSFRVLQRGSYDARRSPSTVEFVMPAMDMPRNVASLKRAPNGQYVGRVLFTMSGDWAAIVRNRLPGDEAIIGRIRITVP